jgi:hypothetical protein
MRNATKIVSGYAFFSASQSASENALQSIGYTIFAKIYAMYYFLLHRLHFCDMVTAAGGFPNEYPIPRQTGSNCKLLSGGEFYPVH